MSTTDDPNDARIKRGPDAGPGPQHEVYLVLSEDERAKGFVRPVREVYVHAGARPMHPVRDLTADERKRFGGVGYVKFEEYPPSKSPALGRFWTEAQLASGCGAETRMRRDLAETFARSPSFYGRTYCTGCNLHLPVAEFTWADGTRVGS